MWLQSKVEEAKFNDVPAANCDIPDTFAVLRVVTLLVNLELKRIH